jgi:hypothetical protein
MDIEERDEKDFDSAEIQLWRYSPAGTATDELVDPLSLWLSLENTTDERIEMARDDLLEQVWSRLL